MLWLSPSAVAKYEECGYQYFLAYIERLQARAKSANLVFGDALDQAVSGHVLAQLNNEPFDAEEAFKKAWKEVSTGIEVQYNSRLDETALVRIGSGLMRIFPEVWGGLGYSPIILPDGKPFLQFDLRTIIAPGIGLRGKVDIGCLTEDGDLHLLDWKSTASASAEVFSDLSEQLTAYQLLTKANEAVLGFGEFNGMGFMELLKKSKPEVCKPYVVAPRPQKALDDYRQKLLWIAEDIRRNRFPKRPRMAYNTPCTMCDFQKACTTGDFSGLTKKPDRNPAQQSLPVSNVQSIAAAA